MNTIERAPILLDNESQLVTDGDNLVGIKRTQEITSTFLDRLKDERAVSTQTRMGDFHKVASIPTAVVEKWMREGFNIFDKNITLKDIIRKLNSEDMGLLMATERRII